MGSGGKSGKEIDVKGWAARDASGFLAPFEFTRMPLSPRDVVLDVLYCGICHTDYSQIHNEWQGSIYPLVPGHEIVGVITDVGSEVKKFSIGDYVGVGYMVDSCRQCNMCQKSAEQYCKRVTLTSNGILPNGSQTFGGFSSLMVVDESFAVKVPKNLPLDAAAPLLCAGITVYSALKHFGMIEAGKHLGVVGLGGLGHMAVKFGKAFGLKVSLISTSPRKEKEAKEVLGADGFIVSKDAAQMEKADSTFDYLLSTISADHALESLLSLLKPEGKLVMVGVPPKPVNFHVSSLIQGRKTIAGSAIGSIEETQEMLDFCAEHGITPMIERISIQDINNAMERLSKGDVKYRFVIDIAGSIHK